MQGRQDLAAARSRSYWLLSRVFLEQPDVGLLRELTTVLDAAGEAQHDSPEAALHASARAALESGQCLTDLQVEYTRLLGGASRTSGAPEPYESVAREGRLFGVSAEAVSAAYIDARHEELVADTGPPDHVGVELRFLALLCYHEMQAWQDGDQAQARSLLSRELSFLDEHVLPWVPSLCDELARATAHPFYIAAAQLAATAPAADRDQITLAMCTEAAWLPPTAH